MESPLRSRVRRLAESVTTPLVPADFLDLFAPLRAGADLRGRIEQVIPETRDAATLVIRPGADWAGHVPGQYLRIGIDVDGVRQWRAYSLTHGPRPDRRIAITVKAVPDGLVSHHLVHDTRPGTLVHLEQAAGEFVLPPEGGRFLFVTAGSGITPVIGMLRNLFPSTDEGVLRPQPERRLRRHRRPRRAEPARLDLRPRPRGARRRRARSGWSPATTTCTACSTSRSCPRWCPTSPSAGPSRAARPGCSTRSSTSTPTRAWSCSPSSSGPAASSPARAAASPSPTAAPSTADGATPILDAAEDAGVLMPSGCRMGICFGCVLPMKEGSVRDLRNGDVTTAVPGESGTVKIQTCINAPAGACQLDHH